MAYVSGKNLLCQVNVGGDNGIYCMDPATGTVVTTIAGAFQWTNTSQRGLAYRPDDDSFYIGGWNEGIVYHIAGFRRAARAGAGHLHARRTASSPASPTTQRPASSGPPPTARPTPSTS